MFVLHSYPHFGRVADLIYAKKLRVNEVALTVFGYTTNLFLRVYILFL